MGWYLTQIGRALSRLLNAIFGGEGDTTFSAFSWELQRRGSTWGLFRVWLVDAINGPGHCRKAWDWHEDHRLFERD